MTVTQRQQKKKKNRRGGRSKKAAAEGEEPSTVTEVQVEAEMPQEQKPEKPVNRADTAAEKDPDLVVLRGRLADAESSVESQAGTRQSWRTELESIIAEVDKQLVAKKVGGPRVGRQTSALLEQSLKELQQSGKDTDMAEDVKKQLQDVRAAEVYSAFKAKLNLLKGRCEELLKSISKNNALPGGGKGAGRPQPSGDKKEAYVIKRLATMHNKDLEEISKEELQSKTLELAPEIMKYLFAPPHMFNGRFESKFSVVVDAVRTADKGAGKGTKGSGKGAKGSQSPKELTVFGLAVQEVEKCMEALRALDFSGAVTKEVDGGMLSSFAKTREIEQEFGVIAFKQRNTVTLFGTKKNVEAAFAKAEAAKAEDSWFTEAVAIDSDKVKAMMPLLNGWRSETNAQIRVTQPQGGEKNATTKVILAAKLRSEVDNAKKKVQEFDKLTISEFLPGDHYKISASGSANARRYREICDNQNLVVVKKSDGLQLMGQRSTINSVKAELIQILKKASIDPATFPLKPEQLRTFGKDNIALIAQKSGAEVWVQRDGVKGSNGPCLVIVGDDEQVSAAKSRIEEVISKEGTVDVMEASDDVMKALKISGGAKIKDLEGRLDIKLTLDVQGGSITIRGSSQNCEAAKESLEKLSQQLGQETVREIKLQPDDIRRVIGPKGSTLRSIRNCGVQVKVDDDTSTVEIKGIEDDVAKAAQMIEEVLGKNDKVPAAKQASAPARAPRPKAEEFKSSVNDFPTLGGGDATGKGAAEKRPARAWGKSEASKSSKDKEAPDGAEENFPALGASDDPDKVGDN